MELEADADAAAAPANATGAVGEEEEEEERIYNPLKLPLGWDGKPIPYWLFKLHGLGVEYRCEICSDGVYMGRYVALSLYFVNLDIDLHCINLGKTSTVIFKYALLTLLSSLSQHLPVPLRNRGMLLECEPWAFQTLSTSTRSPE